MKRMIMMLVVGAAISGWLLPVPAEAKSATCPPDSVRSGPTCMDKYEASAWRIPATNAAGKSNASLINKVKTGTATAALLTAAGATRLGESSDNYAPCADNGSNCTDVFAVSLPGVTPSARITWFQAQQASKNSGKRLPSNAEWQAAVVGTPDPGPDNGSTDCNSATGLASLTGSRSACVSADGAFDMVGNRWEWMADWVPLSTACPGWGGFSNDLMCLSGASMTATAPGALLRGGSFASGTDAGPLSVSGLSGPSETFNDGGFRCAR